MKKSELKDLIKPIVKECVQESVREILLESGMLSSVITEVMKAVGPQMMVERKEKETVHTHTASRQPEKNNKLPDSIQRLKEEKERVLNIIGKEAYGGVNIFEGTSPAPGEARPGDPFGHASSEDPGVDLSSIIPQNGKFRQIK